MPVTDRKNYVLTSPSLEGLLSDDALYFEGVSRPAAYYVLKDAPAGAVSVAGDPIILERYWNDIYNLFLRKISAFAAGDSVVDDESIKLQALLQELIKVKSLLAARADAGK